MINKLFFRLRNGRQAAHRSREADLGLAVAIRLQHGDQLRALGRGTESSPLWILLSTGLSG